MRESCETCKFFSTLASSCRRKPPVVIPIVSPIGKLELMSVFPTTPKDNWCGEYKTADKEPA